MGELCWSKNTELGRGTWSIGTDRGMRPSRRGLSRHLQVLRGESKEVYGWLQHLPPFLRFVVAKLVAAGIYNMSNAPNHCLINEYQLGGGIQSHKVNRNKKSTWIRWRAAKPSLKSAYRIADCCTGRAPLLPLCGNY